MDSNITSIVVEAITAENKELVEYLFEKRGLLSIIKTLPKVGFLAIEGAEPTAAAFLRNVEGGYGLLDGLISNPDKKAFIRHLGIDAVVRALVERSRVLGVRQLLAYSDDESVLVRSKHHNFKKLPHTLITLDLTV